MTTFSVGDKVFDDVLLEWGEVCTGRHGSRNEMCVVIGGYHNIYYKNGTTLERDKRPRLHKTIESVIEANNKILEGFRDGK